MRICDVLLIGAIGGAVPACAAQGAFTIFDDVSMFDSVAHTLIDFETRGDGTPWNFAEGEARFMNSGEYDAQGLRWGGGGSVIANTTGADFEAGIAQVGSLQHTVFIDNSMGFLTPVSSVGFGVILNQAIAEPLEIRLDFAHGTIVRLAFDEMFIDGVIGDIAFGFIGFRSDIDILGVAFNQFQGYNYDDVRFTPVPAPGTVIVLFFGSLAATQSRRRIPVTAMGQ